MASFEEMVAQAAKQVVQNLLDKGQLAEYGSNRTADQLSDNNQIVINDGASQGEAPMCKVYVFPDRNKFRVRVVDTDTGKKKNYVYNTREEADAAVPKLEKEYRRPVGVLLSEALDQYYKYMEEKGNRPRPIQTTKDRFGVFFRGQEKTMTGEFTQTLAGDVWQKFITTPGRFTKHVPSVNTQSSTLSQVKTFFKWVGTKRWLKGDINPFGAIEVLGRRKRGKLQLVGIDESKKFLDKVEELARKGDVGAVAAATALLMGMRASEITDRLVCELDDGGKMFVITSAKTEAGIRRLKIPEALQPMLQALVSGRNGDERIFGDVDRQWLLKNVKRCCKLAGVRIITTHGLRGTHASLATAAGCTGESVAAALGHDSFAVTERHYAKAESVSGARVDRVTDALN